MGHCLSVTSAQQPSTPHTLPFPEKRLDAGPQVFRCCCSVAKLGPVLCSSVDCSMSGRLPHLSLSPGVCSNSCPLNRWCHPTISSSVASFSCPQSFPVSGLFQWVDSLHHVAKVLELYIQHQSFQWIFSVDFLKDWLVLSPCSSRDSQESSPIPHLESINSSTSSLLDSPTLTSIHDYWKNQSSVYMDLCRQNDVSAF